MPPQEASTDPISFTVFDGASLTQLEPGAVDFTTPATNWRPAFIGTFVPGAVPNDAVGARATIDLELVSGKIGVFLATSSASTGQEITIETPGRHQISLESKTSPATGVGMRSLDRGSARGKIHGITATLTRRFDIAPVIEEIFPTLLRQPGESIKHVVAQALSRHLGRPVKTEELASLELSSAAPMPLRFPRLETIFNDEIGQVAVSETRRLTDLLSTCEVEKLGDFLGHLDRNFYAAYFRETIIRVYHLAHLLRELGMTGGTVLEIGSLMGNFSASLQRLGYQVTAVDRYRSYGGGLSGYTDYMRSLGVTVEELTREDEVAHIANLGQFDAVICLAVIEHIPPPARPFLEMLASHVKPGGILALDTPNIVRYWNRVAMSDGKSIHQDLTSQYHTEPPWEGHYREYTPDEMVWMMEQVGCSDVRLKLFDYNLIQFEELWSGQIPSLLAMTLDPTLTDTILVGGRLGKARSRP
jgi:2-polyprenyl-3-methyl-5-hydroxy-6-metoxy-1,4-benzoquinol methylase